MSMKPSRSLAAVRRPGATTGTRRACGLVPLAWLAIAGIAQAAGEPRFDQLEGPETAYGARLAFVLRHWSRDRAEAEPAPEVQIVCLPTVGAEASVGILRRARIAAPLAAVEAVLDDVGHFKDLFPGTVDAHVVESFAGGSAFTTAWEQRVPVFFLPNVTYELSHAVDKSRADRAVYRYKLKRSDSIKASDGLTVLEPMRGDVTELTEYGYFEMRSAMVPSSILWKKGVQGAFVSVAAIKLKAEHPSWSYAQIAAESDRLATQASPALDRCVAERGQGDVQRFADPDVARGGARRTPAD